MNIKREAAPTTFEIIIKMKSSNPIKQRESQYVGRGVDSDCYYHYGEWVDTFEPVEIEVFRQVVAELDLAKVIMAVNNLEEK